MFLNCWRKSEYLENTPTCMFHTERYSVIPGYEAMICFAVRQANKPPFKEVNEGAFIFTHHIERHDDHKVDTDTGARCCKLPVLLHKLPVKGGKLFHHNKAKNHHSKHSSQDERNLHRDKIINNDCVSEILMFQ